MDGENDGSIVFFCDQCGLRLISQRNSAANVTYDEKTLLEDSSGIVSAPEISRQWKRFASSPLGAPLRKDVQWIMNPQQRYINLCPTRVFAVRTGRFQIPSSFTSLAQETAPSYLVEAPGIAEESAEDKKQWQYLLSDNCAWNRHRPEPHFRIKEHTPQAPEPVEVAQVTLYGGSNWDAKLETIDRNATAARQWHRTTIKAMNDLAWSRDGAGVLWQSTQGIVLWNMRKLSDGAGATGRMLCLLDAYDRLIAVVRKTTGAGAQLGHGLEMRVYASVKHDYLAEIIASYVALMVQGERIAQERLNDSS